VYTTMITVSALMPTRHSCITGMAGWPQSLTTCKLEHTLAPAPPPTPTSTLGKQGLLARHSLPAIPLFTIMQWRGNSIYLISHLARVSCRHLLLACLQSTAHLSAK
jgi:hypothetical protein